MGYTVRPERPLIRWAGSKRKLIPVMKQNSPSIFERYIEPFCGSISFFLEQEVQKAYLTDINSELINFYKVVQSDPGYISDGMEMLESSKEQYYKVRSLDPGSLTDSDRAVRFFYLNRHCFNGVYRTNLKGQFNVPYGSKLTSIPCRAELLAFSKILSNVTFEACDFEKSVSRSGEGDFVYLDPPYAGREVKDRGEYGLNKFQESDIYRMHEVLEKASARGAKILLSYADITQVRDIFSGWHINTISVGRSVSGFAKGRSIVSEVLVKNY